MLKFPTRGPLFYRFDSKESRFSNFTLHNITLTKVCCLKRPLLTHKSCSKQLFVIQLSKQAAVSSLCCLFSEKKSRMVLFLLILLKVSQSISAQPWQIPSTQMYFRMSFNLLSNIWLKCGARFDPQAEIDQKP